MSKYEVLDKGKWPHFCSKPGAFKRFLLRLKTGAMVKCKECGAEYQFEYDYEGTPRWRRDHRV